VGGVVSPILANVYLHYVLDEWVETVVKPRMRGEVYLIRYADDHIICFQYREDAERVAETLRKRFAKYGLELHEEKTRLIPFGRFAEENLRRQGQHKPPTFDFLSFTHICTRGRNGKFTVHVRTSRTRMRRAMQRMADWCRDHRHWPLADQHRAISRALRGHYAYYGRVSNHLSLDRFRRFTTKTWLKWLRRRSQRRRLSWAKYSDLLRWYPLPKPHVLQRAFARR
jgi:hypothetical protein